ncbi:hypothetical protein [Mesorhizobium sp.]|uniref:hypothetical protein n=1 Tax=Mesorhizobium sp. TaxID=1871066 RepID=UPI00120B751E|nr:hypothetical protein [Mesorhizobium sp.]TIL65602.1 MAG: hypothetical protein E5Y77_20675 [Mesorhizobium sp.]
MHVESGLEQIPFLRVNPRHLRSIQIERDYADPAASTHYLVTPFIKATFERLTQSLIPGSTARAWRITGDYGAGKSSFGLAFARYAEGALEGLPQALRESPPLIRLAPVLVAGEREPVARSLTTALGATVARLGMRPSKSVAKILAHPLGASASTIVQALEAVAAQVRTMGLADGLLVVLDELGKNLEYAARTTDDDVHLLQLLAEVAARSGETPIVVMAVLHQGVAAYTQDLAIEQRREWEKVSGRFEEVLFAPPLEQSALLVAAALDLDQVRLPAGLVKHARSAMRQALAAGWYGVGAPVEDLAALAPQLLPLDALVLPVLVRILRRFGQNERSLFSFLSSAEPHGLMDHARAAHERLQVYRLNDLYDYLTTNLSSALAAGPAATRFGVVDSVIRSAMVDNALEVAALKAVGLLNLLDDPGLCLTRELLVLALAGGDSDRLRAAEAAVERLSTTSKLLYDRGAGGGLCLWPHTSVDLETALQEGLKASEVTDGLLDALRRVLPSDPVLARRHYVETGALRHFEVIYAEPTELRGALAEAPDLSRVDGRIVVALNRTTAERREVLEIISNHKPWNDVLLVGAPEPVGTLAPLLRDIRAWTWVRENTPALAGDRLARQEVSRQLDLAEDRLRRALNELLDLRGDGAGASAWFHNGERLAVESGRDLAARLSEICDTAYRFSPRVRNELINRRVLSSAAARARSLLVEALALKADQPLLGLDETHTPPEMAIYLSVLRQGGVHVERNGCWGVEIPAAPDPLRLIPVLERIGELLTAEGDRRVPYLDIVEALRVPPYGVRDGLIPLLLAVYLSAHWHHTAVYEDGTYLDQAGSPEFARMLKEPEHFAIQHCAVEGVRTEVFTRLAAILGVPAQAQEPDLLDVVRPLLQFVARLPDHARRTRSISVTTAAVRAALLRASDPSALLFTDLPLACGLEPFTANGPLEEERLEDFVRAMAAAVRDMRDAYPALLDRLTAAVADIMDAPGPLEAVQVVLARRAAPAKGAIVETELKAFALRLADGALPPKAWLESIASFLARKPPERWAEPDEREFHHRLKLLGRRFSRVLATIVNENGRLDVAKGETAFHVVITSADGQEFNDLVRGTAVDPQVDGIQLEFAELLSRHGRKGVLAAARALVAVAHSAADEPKPAKDLGRPSNDQ